MARPSRRRLRLSNGRRQASGACIFCDGSGFPLDDTQPGIQAPGFNFTAYLTSDYVVKLLAENQLEIANLDAPTSKLLDIAKEAMRDHFRQRASERAAGLVEEWQRERVYPYQGQPETPVEEAERQVFNVVALNVNHFLPNFQESDEPLPGVGQAQIPPAFLDWLITLRNQRMRDHVLPLLKRGAAFVAIGAARLPEKEGLLSLFEKEGYEVETIE
jgi:TraB/PrgY/gumN family